MSERCECCDLEVSSCGKAAEQRQRAEAAADHRRLRARGWFPAGYAGCCELCGEPFDVGALINYSGGGGYRSRCCS